MEDRRFDEMAKRLAAGGSRRTLIGGGVGAALAAVLGLRVPAAEAAVSCREFRRKCTGADQCCGGKSACRRVTKLTCDLDGRRCCGTEGAFCANGDTCSCCGDLVCNPTTNRCNLPL